ncbi:MAG: glycosyltransferase family 1 protein [Chromatiaceae bacterium]|nr:MAG: glycosyltransferase family 1 protein [Chromatiaceae bacterium]
MIEALVTSEQAIGAAWFCDADLPYAESILNHADRLVLCRARYSPRLAELVIRAGARGIPVIYDIDDLVFDDRYVHFVLNTLDQGTSEGDLDFWFADIGRHGALLRLCDRAIGTNAYLAERIAEFSGLAVATVPNFLNQAQIEVSAAILAAKRAADFVRDGRIHLGYFSGTPTHRRDFAVIVDSLLQLLRADARIVLRIVGFLELPPAFSEFQQRIEYYPLQDFLNLQRLIGEVEINLVPLQDNVFTNCKSELKVFEAAVVGTISVGTPTYTIERALSVGSSGFLATAQNWYPVLTQAIARLDDYPQMAEAAAAEALACYAPAAQGAAVLQALYD